MLIKKCKKITNYYLPVVILTKNGLIRSNWFYEDENTLYKAYRQLKFLNLNIKPLFPVVVVERIF